MTPQERLRSILDIIDKPLLSIVTIYDTANKVKWLDEFIGNLPTCKEGQVELILCKNVPQDEAPQPPEKRNGIVIHHVVHKYEEFSFADSRNVAQTAASGRWILALDTDEAISQVEFEKLLRIITHSPTDAHNVLIGGSNHSRLYRNQESIVWRSAIHETIMFSVLENNLQLDDTDIQITHKGYDLDVTGMMLKLRRNLRMICREYHKHVGNSLMRSYLELNLFDTISELKSYEENGN